MRYRTNISRLRIFTGIALVAGLLVIGTTSSRVNAASAADWRAGNIINDSLFYNGGDMSASEVQAFLNSRVPTCDTWGTQPSEYGGGSRAQYGASKGYPAPYICLKDYSQNVPGYGADAYCGAIGGGLKSAAQIIKDVSQACGIGSKVLIVLLQKEQSLITDAWPWPNQYQKATGFACPDTAPCDTQYAGYFNQVYRAARQYKVYRANPNNYRYKARQNNAVLFNPNAGCGSSTVYIENDATTGLYTYTPYQPNQAALNNLYGSGDGCSAYGNRNFWRMYTDWFGSTQSDGFVPLDDPRWMKLKVNTYKRSLPSGNSYEPELTIGRQIYFPDKVQINGVWYLRTQWDKDNGNQAGIPLSDLTEIEITAITPSWKSTTSVTAKKDPLRKRQYEQLDSRTGVKVVDSITVNGEVFYRTAYERQLGRSRFISVDTLEDYRLYNLDQPRTLYTANSAKKVNIRTGAQISTVPDNTFLFFSKRVTIDGVMYLQETGDNGTDVGIAIDNLKEAYPLPFVPLDDPRWMKLKVNTYKRSLPSGNSYEPELTIGRQIYFPDKVQINGVWYLRTQWDKDNGNQAGIPLSDLTEM